MNLLLVHVFYNSSIPRISNNYPLIALVSYCTSNDALCLWASLIRGAVNVINVIYIYLPPTDPHLGASKLADL